MTDGDDHMTHTLQNQVRFLTKYSITIQKFLQALKSTKKNHNSVANCEDLTDGRKQIALI